MTRYIDYGRMSIKNLELSEKVQKYLITHLLGGKQGFSGCHLFYILVSLIVFR
jgi:hypothetical protein